MGSHIDPERIAGAAGVALIAYDEALGDTGTPTTANKIDAMVAAITAALTHVETGIRQTHGRVLRKPSAPAVIITGHAGWYKPTVVKKTET